MIIISFIGMTDIAMTAISVTRVAFALKVLIILEEIIVILFKPVCNLEICEKYEQNISENDSTNEPIEEEVIPPISDEEQKNENQNSGAFHNFVQIMVDQAGFSEYEIETYSTGISKISQLVMDGLKPMPSMQKV